MGNESTQKIIEKFKSSLFITAWALLDYKDVSWPTHGDMINSLESPSKRKLIVMPRGSLKSSVGIVAYSIWLILKYPNIRILIDSQNYSNSKNFLREIRSHMKSDKFLNLFGDLEGDTWTEGALTVKTRSKALKEATITASGIGASKTGQHYDVIICDDLNSDTNSNTKENRQKVIDHYRMNISILEPDGTLVVIGTRYHEDDVIGYIIKNEIEETHGTEDNSSLLGNSGLLST